MNYYVSYLIGLYFLQSNKYAVLEHAEADIDAHSGFDG